MNMGIVRRTVPIVDVFTHKFIRRTPAKFIGTFWPATSEEWSLIIKDGVRFLAREGAHLFGWKMGAIDTMGIR